MTYFHKLSRIAYENTHGISTYMKTIWLYFYFVIEIAYTEELIWQALVV